MQYVKSLKFKKDPDYALLKNYFENCLKEKDYENDSIFDWTFKLKAQNTINAFSRTVTSTTNPDK